MFHMLRVINRRYLLGGLMLSLILCLFLFAVSFANAAAPTVAWSKQYGGSDVSNVVADSICTTDDGGYAIAGYAVVSGGPLDRIAHNQELIYVARLDSSGNELWHQVYGRFSEYKNGVKSGVYGVSHANAIIQTRDGGFIVTGFSGYNITLFKISADGAAEPQWSQIYPGHSLFQARGSSVRQTSDGGYIVTGYDSNVSHAPYRGFISDIYLVKTDANGELQWSRHFGGRENEVSNSVRQTSDGGYIIIGDEDLFDLARSIYVIKTDSYGNQVWNQSYSGPDYSAGYGTGYDVIQLAYGGYILTGNNVLLKIDANGSLQWAHKLDLAGINTAEAQSIQQTSDGGYLIGGLINSNQLMSVIRTDNNGTILWNQSFDTKTGILEDVQGAMTNDGGYIMAGFTINGNAQNPEKALVVKFANFDSSTPAVRASTGSNGTENKPLPANNKTIPTPKPLDAASPGMDGLMATIALVFVLALRSLGKR